MDENTQGHIFDSNISKWDGVSKKETQKHLHLFVQICSLGNYESNFSF